MELAILEDVTRALSLMEEVMRDGGALAPDYPLIFGRDQAGRVAVAEEEGEIVSSCAILERELVCGSPRPRVGLIGSVSTSARHRGRGLATAVLERAEQELLSDGCLLALLWAEDPTFYEKREYQDVGAEIDFVLAPELAPHLPATRGVRPARESDFTTMHRCYANHQRRAERSAAESRALFATPGSQIVVHERNGRVDAYACLGCGLDLNGVIHEWAGDRDGVLSCVRAFLEERGGSPTDTPLYLMAPMPAGGVGDRLGELGVPSAPGILGMAKLLDERAATDLIVGASDELIRAERLEGGSWRLKGPAGARKLRRSELLTVLFSPRGDRQPVVELEDALGTRFPVLPWTPFLWGLDSI